MSGILTAGATVRCAHGGSARVPSPGGRVFIAGEAVLTVASRHLVSGCSYTVNGVTSPCTTVAWSAPSTRLTVGGAPVLVESARSTCAPNGTPASVSPAGSKVSGR